VVRKNPQDKKGCKVTFELPAAVSAESVQLCGEFNDWSLTATPLARRKDGRFSVTVTLELGRTYRYRYLVDGERWENDWAADAYTPNEYGGDDSVIDLTEVSRTT
jgi:1,4-alpha-glucan branching enzyme